MKCHPPSRIKGDLGCIYDLPPSAILGTCLVLAIGQTPIGLCTPGCLEGLPSPPPVQSGHMGSLTPRMMLRS